MYLFEAKVLFSDRLNKKVLIYVYAENYQKAEEEILSNYCDIEKICSIKLLCEDNKILIENEKIF